MTSQSNPAPNLLLLTATITPPAGAPQLARTDPNLRLKDYAAALEFYLKKLGQSGISGIVFADNSNSDTSSLKELVKRYGAESQVEFISFSGLDYPLEYGRGYGEFSMVDYVMQNSALVKSLPANGNIWKITGRYQLQNLTELIDTKPVAAEIYCNCRNRPAYWVDLYVLSWTQSAYQQLLANICERIKEGTDKTSAEKKFRTVLDQASTNVRVHKRFKRVPNLHGFRGLDNKGYADMGVKFRIRQIAVRLAPWLWI